MVIVAPSILAADFARLGEQVVESEQGGAGRIHIDVMDGHFVPNLTFGPLTVAAVRRATSLPIEAHLMIERPELFLEAFDLDYSWPLLSALNNVLFKSASASELKRSWEESRRRFPQGSLHLRISDDHEVEITCRKNFGTRNKLLTTI